MIKRLHRCSGLAEAEAMVAQLAGRTDGGEGLAGLLLASSSSSAGCVEKGAMNWAMQVTLDKDAGGGFRVKSLGPAPLRGCSTFMHRAIG